MKIFATCLIALLSASLQSAGTIAPPPDVEVVGRIKNISYDQIYDPEDLLGHGWITARMRVSKVLYGNLSSRVITIRYLAHSERNERHKFRFRLRANPDQTYTVCAEPGGIGLVCGRSQKGLVK
jgi:hypothetical protein